MMNTNVMGVEELDQQMMTTTDGGIVGAVVGAIVVGVVTNIVWDAAANWEDFKKEVAAGYND